MNSVRCEGGWKGGVLLEGRGLTWENELKSVDEMRDQEVDTFEIFTQEAR